MVEKINVVVGYDQRESVAYHTFTQSIMEKSSLPVSFTPLAINTLKGYQETHADKSNDFVYSRFLTPYLNAFSGWAIFADGDMICQSDVKELWDLRLGPAIWDKVLERIPIELVTDENTYGYQNFLLMEIFSLPAKKMLVLLKEIVAQTPVGDRLLNELIDAIKENMNQYNQDMVSHDANEALGIFNDDLDEVADETDEDELKDILGSMGIGLSDDDDEEDLEDEEY